MKPERCSGAGFNVNVLCEMCVLAEQKAIQLFVEALQVTHAVNRDLRQVQ